MVLKVNLKPARKVADAVDVDFNLVPNAVLNSMVCAPFHGMLSISQLIFSRLDASLSGIRLMPMA